MASNGVTFLDGNLIAGAGITTAILGFDETGRDVLQLYTPEKNVPHLYAAGLTLSLRRIIQAAFLKEVFARK